MHQQVSAKKCILSTEPDVEESSSMQNSASAVKNHESTTEDFTSGHIINWKYVWSTSSRYTLSELRDFYKTLDPSSYSVETYKSTHPFWNWYFLSRARSYGGSYYYRIQYKSNSFRLDLSAVTPSSINIRRNQLSQKVLYAFPKSFQRARSCGHVLTLVLLAIRYTNLIWLNLSRALELICGTELHIAQTHCLRQASFHLCVTL